PPRPVLRLSGAAGRGGHAPTALAVVLDNSLSSSAIVAGHPVLDELRERAVHLVRSAAANDRLWLVTADGTVRGGTPAALLDAIGRTEPLTGAGDIEDATQRAAGLASSSGLPEREVAVLTDGQATAWRDPLSLGAVAAFAFRPRSGPPPNRAVIEAVAQPARWTPRGAVAARVLTLDSATYRITLEGRTLARGTVARDEPILVRAEPPERGWTTGSVELEPDELRGDDVRWFATWIGPAPAVHLSPSAGPFAANAIAALVAADRASVGNGITVAPADEATVLPALLMAPSDPIRLGAANRALDRLGIQWRFGAARHGETPVRAAPGAPVPLTDVSAMVRYPLSPLPGARADTLATAAGEPWIVAGPGYVLIASPLTPDATTFPVRAAFVPWLGDVLSQRLGTDAGQVVAAAPAAVVPRPRDADALEMPGGQRLALLDDSLTAPDRPGAYFFLHGPSRVGALVVNVQPEESNLQRLDTMALASRLRARRVVASVDGAAFTRAVFASAPRRPLAAPFFALALAALVAESVVAGTARRTG
ncbi:MAG TPA: VWA domain-containing protein, partial [Gemmatimonadaceae bacterium]